jgi:hypothetical protein
MFFQSFRLRPLKDSKHKNKQIENLEFLEKKFW